MTTRDKLIEEARKGVLLRTSELASRWGVSRQTVSGQLRRLVEEGLLEKSGSTRNATYVLAGKVGPSGSGRDTGEQTRRESIDHSVSASSAHSSSHGGRWRWSGASLSASVALGLLMVAVLVLQWGSDRAAEPGSSARVEGRSVEAAPGSSAAEVFDRVQTIGADRHLALANMNVSAGSEVTLQAGEMVALGDGFTVDRNAALVVKIEDPREP